jgi:hypothetical protein
MPLRQTVHTCRVRASSNLLGQSIHFMALANAEFVKPLEPNKKPPGTEMFDRRHRLALRRRRPVTLILLHSDPKADRFTHQLQYRS